MAGSYFVKIYINKGSLVKNIFFIFLILFFHINPTFDQCFAIVKYDLLQRASGVNSSQKMGLPDGKYSYFISECYQEVLNKYELEIKERQEQRILLMDELNDSEFIQTFEISEDSPLKGKLVFFQGNNLQFYIHKEVIKILDQISELKNRNPNDDFFCYIEEITINFLTKVLDYNQSKDAGKSFSNLDLCYNYLYLGLEIENYLNMIEISTI